MNDHFTVGELGRMFGLPDWKIRQAVDGMGEGVSRVGGYRIVPRSMLGKLAAELAARGWLKTTEPQEAAP